VFESLEQLSNAVGIVSAGDVKQVADAVNRRLMGLLGASVVKLYWSERAERGVILAPFTFVNQTENEDPRPFQLPPEPDGVLSWVFSTGHPLWLEGLGSKDLGQPVRNEASGEMVPPTVLDLRADYRMDSTLCMPLTVRGTVLGVYAVELQTSGRLQPPILGLMQRLGRSLSSLLWNVDVYRYDQERTSRAVQQFLSSIQHFRFDPIFLEEDFRSGFIARPFKPEFADVETRIAKLFSARGIRARAYRPSGRTEYIIDEIQKDIGGSHFCIADVTAENANVMAEVGMMMTMRKHFMLIRRHGDRTPPPFDVSAFPVYEYDVADQGLRFWDPGASQFQPFEQCLDSFLDHLPTETGFATAGKWSG
jgi:hypothetical protein